MIKWLQATSGFEGLFWLVLAFVWIVVQLLGRATGKGRTHGPRPRQGGYRPPRPTGMEEELKEFLETLTGTTVKTYEEEEEEEPESAYSPPPVPPIPARTPQILPMSAAPSVAEIAEFPYEQEEDSPYAPQEDITDYDHTPIESMKELTHGVVSPASFLVGLRGLNMPIILNVPLATPHITHHTGLRPNFKNPRNVKQAIIGRIIMGPPTALSADPSELDLRLR